MLEIDLNDRVAIVTGTTRGIGLGVAKMLAKAGCHIAGCSTRPKNSEGVRLFMDTIKNFGVEVLYRKCNMTNPEDIDCFVNTVGAHFGRIDIVVSNAGVNVFKGVDNATLKDWRFNTELNFRSHWLISKKSRPYLEKSEHLGCVLIMTSNHAYSSIPGCFPYNATKAGLLGLVKAMALEWKNKIRVMGIAPGFIETEGGETWYKGFEEPAKEKQKTIDRHLVPKLGTVDQVGALCAFLASEHASFMTGTTYLMDGGRSAIMQDE